MTSLHDDWHEYLARRAEEVRTQPNPAKEEQNRQTAIAQAFAAALTSNQKKEA